MTDTNNTDGAALLPVTREALIDEIISMYHTTRLSGTPAATHILSKGSVQDAFARFEMGILARAPLPATQEDAERSSSTASSVESAYREGHSRGRVDGSCYEETADWQRSKAFASLANTPAESSVGADEGLRIADMVCVDVAELPDRSSPDDQPDMMLVTQDELHLIVTRAVDYVAALAASSGPASAGDEGLREDHRKLALFHASGGTEVTWEEVDGIVARALSATPAQEVDETERLPADVRRLVIAARDIAFNDWDGDSEEWETARKELDDASEAFASRVPWEDEPAALSTDKGEASRGD